MIAKERWQRLEAKRSVVLKRARDCSALTIPSLIPPEGTSDNTILSQPYQSLGARGANNLASKLMLALFPPGQNAFRLQAPPEVLAGFGEQRTEVEGKLSAIERKASDALDRGNLRPAVYDTLLHLIIGGNVLFYKNDENCRIYGMNRYVVSRDPAGNPVEVVVRETVAVTVIKPAVRLVCKVDEKNPDGQPSNVDVYTVIEWKDGRVHEWQEINDIVVPGSKGDVPIKMSRWLPLRWRSVLGSDYGRSHVEEYFGDLRSLEGLTSSLVQFAAAAAKILFLVRPGAVTKVDDIFKAASGAAVSGLKDDVQLLQMEKFADFQVVKSVADGIELRLSHAFLLRSGTVRDAERVTAEEIRALAQELEDALGGNYTVLGSEFQLPLIRVHLNDMIRRKELPALPDGVVEPVIITGFQALGRNHAVNRLRAYLADLAIVDPELSTVKKPVVAKRLGIGHGVEELDELIKTADEVTADQQQAMAMQMADKIAGPMAGALTKDAPA